MSRYAIGIMSGTALDGIDVVLVRLNGCYLDTECEVIDFESYTIQPELRKKIIAVSHPETSRVDEICSLNVELGQRYSEAVSLLLKKSGFNERLAFIASHGQTIHHLPRAAFPQVRSTLQIGDPSQLAYDHHTQVVFNFRMMDMVAGGDGAPLVPYTEFILYRQKEKSILLQNIGGIGNVTILPKNCTLDEVSAFDTGPGNMMINSAMNIFFQKNFDRDGLCAQQGQLIPPLFDELCQHPFLQVKPPKSTGREEFGEDMVQTICQRYFDQPYDVIYTLTRYAAYTIAASYQRFIMPEYSIDEIIIGGGGANNPVLMAELQKALPDYQIMTQDMLGYSSDAKEAIAFAILGNETLYRKPGNVPRATGARVPLILGQICPDPWGVDV